MLRQILKHEAGHFVVFLGGLYLITYFFFGGGWIRNLFFVFASTLWALFIMIVVCSISDSSVE